MRNKLLTGAALASALALATHFEGTRYNAYLDPVGIATICQGHTQGVKLGQNATAAQCEAWLGEELEASAQAVDLLTTAPVGSLSMVALADFVYNVGSGTYQRSSVLREWNAGRPCVAATWLLKYNKAGGKVLPGLTARRVAEYKLIAKEHSCLPL
jgi:lysozyme